MGGRKYQYSKGGEAQFEEPSDFPSEEVRFLLGRNGKNPLVCIGMNPSTATIEHSDPTTDIIIQFGKDLDYDGWCIVNVYPKRSSEPEEVGAQPFDKDLAKKNCDVIANYLQKKEIKEVWGAWGDCTEHGEPFVQGKHMLQEKLKELDIKIFYFDKLTAKGNPYHPRAIRIHKLEISKSARKYLT